jgi:hypothetical protein
MRWVGVRRSEFFGCQQFEVCAFLELDDINFTKLRCDHDHLTGNVHLPHVVATDFGYNFWDHSAHLSSVGKVKIQGGKRRR